MLFILLIAALNKVSAVPLPHIGFTKLVNDTELEAHLKGNQYSKFSTRNYPSNTNEQASMSTIYRTATLLFSQPRIKQQVHELALNTARWHRSFQCIDVFIFYCFLFELWV